MLLGSGSSHYLTDLKFPYVHASFLKATFIIPSPSHSFYRPGEWGGQKAGQRARLWEQLFLCWQLVQIAAPALLSTPGSFAVPLSHLSREAKTTTSPKHGLQISGSEFKMG